MMQGSRVPSANNISWERMIRAVEKVRERVQRAAAALDRAGIAYAVVGGNAVASWVSTVDAAAVRNTQDVDILIRRIDLEAVKAALAPAGFSYQEVFGVEMFLDGPDANPRDAVHLLFSGERVKPDDLAPAPDVAESEPGSGGYRILYLESLVRMKLTSFRRKDQVHVQDLIGLGLIDASWIGRFPPQLAARLQELLDDPKG
jgi:hypothetical protein